MRLALGTLSLALVGSFAPAQAVAPPATAPDRVERTVAAGQRAAAPALVVRRAVGGLRIPWDVQAVDARTLLITERDTRRLLLNRSGRTTTVAFPSQSVWASGETGLMSLAIDPGFGSNRRFYTCAGGFTSGGGHDVRVAAWTLSADGRRALPARTLLTGLPATSGRHGGCRLLITRDGALLVGTGDAAVGTNSQNLGSLGGKVLRLNRSTGAPWPKNPWARSSNAARRYVLTYGHRNVQGLAQRADGSLWSVEHGSHRDDEVNRLRSGGNYGWSPVPGYNESRPMTDQSLPGRQIGARWRSGTPTIATSGAAWVRGKRWGVYNGTLAVATLAGQRLVFMKFTKAGKLRWTRSPQALRTHGRLRSVSRAPNGDLLVTTSNGSNDSVLRVAPRR